MVHFTYLQENMTPPHYENPHRSPLRLTTDKPTSSNKHLHNMESPRVHPYKRPQGILSKKNKNNIESMAEKPSSSSSCSGPHAAAFAPAPGMVRSQSLRSVDLEMLPETPSSFDIFQALPSPVEDATYTFETETSHAHLNQDLNQASALSDLLMSSSGKMEQNITFRPSFFMPSSTFGNSSMDLDTFDSPSSEAKQQDDFDTNHDLYLPISSVPFSRISSLNVEVPPSLRVVHSDDVDDDVTLLPPLMDLDSPYTSPLTSPMISPISSAPNSPTPPSLEYDTELPQLKTPPREFGGLVLPPSFSNQRYQKTARMISKGRSTKKNTVIAKKATGLTIKGKKGGPRYRSRSDAVLTRKFVIPPSLQEDPVLDGEVSIGEYTRAERRAKLIKFKEKKRRGIEIGFVRYKCRKNFADKRPRVGGRFVKLKK